MDNVGINLDEYRARFGNQPVLRFVHSRTLLCRTLLLLQQPFRRYPRHMSYHYPDITTRAEQYRVRAGQCQQAAQEAGSPQAQDHYRFLAETWRRLAQMIDERWALTVDAPGSTENQ